MYKCALCDSTLHAKSAYKVEDMYYESISQPKSRLRDNAMTNSKIDALLEKKKAIDAQIKAARARDRSQKRKNDTRRKIIAGALALEHAELHPDSEFTRTILSLIQRHVIPDKDRALFDLDPLEPVDSGAKSEWDAVQIEPREAR